MYVAEEQPKVASYINFFVAALHLPLKGKTFGRSAIQYSRYEIVLLYSVKDRKTPAPINIGTRALYAEWFVTVFSV